MSDSNSVVHEGWLSKSSTNKQPWKSGWKRLWFVLRSTGHIPGQYLLQYYTNNECRKLKGSIDLDELEQVDAGLALKFGSGSKTQDFIFDIRTKTKEYYFATSSEEDMNKWVKSICSVCRLKLASSPDDPPPNYVPPNYVPPNGVVPPDVVPSTGLLDYRNSPHAISSSSSFHPPPSSSYSDNNNAPHYEERLRSERPSKLPGIASAVIHHQKDASISSCESSGPYIPISECHSGNPSDTRANESSGDVKNASTGNASVTKNVILADELYDFPKSSTSSSTVSKGLHDSPVKGAHTSMDESGNNNWPNFATCKDDIIRASVRSCSALDSSKSNSTLTRDSRNSQSFHSASRLRAASNAPNKESNLYINGNNNCGNMTNDASALPARVPPPRPPKPATLRKNKSQSHSTSSLGTNNNELVEDHQYLQSVPLAPIVTVSQVDESYDIPKSCMSGNKDTVIHLDQVVPLSTTPTVYIRGKVTDASPLSQSLSRTSDVTPVELYDFPRSTAEVNASPVTSAIVSKSDMVIDLNATVPMPSALKKDIGGKNSYTNAPCGFMSTKESVFNYDYKPSLPVTSDEQSNTLSPHSDLNHLSSMPERSPRTPNSAFSPGNELTPPAVDRKFKPRKTRNSESDATASPTTPHPFPLSPPPATARKSNFSTSTLPSSKSFKNKNGQHSYESIPRSCNTLGHRASSSTGCHLRGHSISEDDTSGCTRNEESKVHLPRKQKQIPEQPELQYLDLDLNDSDHSSPRTPNLIEANNHVSSMSNHKQHTLSSSPMKERNTTAAATVTANVIPSATSKSTVYKTVDFVKTDALNKVRHTFDQTGKI